MSPAEPSEADDYYAAVLIGAEAAAFDLASHVEGLDREIQLLRYNLRSALRDHPEDYELIQSQVAAIVKAVSAQYRMSARQRDDLAASLKATLEDIGSALWPSDA